MPLITVWHLPFTDVQIVLENSTDPNGMRYFKEVQRKNIPWMSNSLILLIVISITSALALLMNMYVIFQLIKHRLWHKFKCTQNFSSQDLKMFGYSMLIFSTEVISCIQQYAFYSIKDVSITNGMFYSQFFIADIVTLAPAWFLLLTNKQLKNEIKKCFLFVLVSINTLFPPQIVRPSSTINH